MPIVLLILLWTSPLYGYELGSNDMLRGCPFIHDDANGQTLDLLDQLIRTHLKTKIEGNQRCEAAFRSVVTNFDSINQVFSNNVNPSLSHDVKSDMLQQHITQLDLDLLAAAPGSTALDAIAADIKANNFLLQQTKNDATFNRQAFSQQRTNTVMSGVFHHLSDAITVLARLDPTCVMQLGDWQTIMPVILNMASSLTSFAGSTPVAALGGSLKVLSSITYILRDLHAKNALLSLIRQRNNKLLACTYYVVQHAACDYRRHLRFSQEYQHIKDFIAQRYVKQDTKIYDEFFYLQQQSHSFESIFFEISAMGSAVTLDVDVMTRYFRAKRSSPETILLPKEVGPPPSDDDEASDADTRRQAWLIKVKARGIFFQERDQTGTLKSLKLQIKEALTDITNKRADITSVETLVTHIRSFIDLKHRLDEDPSSLAKVQRFKSYFLRILNQEIVATENVGLVMSALRILEALEYFLSIKYGSIEVPIEPSPTITPTEDSHPTPPAEVKEEQQRKRYAAYYAAVNHAGRMLFEKMSEGAVAQVDQQTILTIGNIVQARLDRVFTLLENEFYRHETMNPPEENAKGVKFSDYQRDHAMLVDAVLNYDTVSGSGTTFRAEDISLAIGALEKGFRREIRRMIKDALKSSSDFLPGLEGTTAAHLCALFSPSLRKRKFDSWFGDSLWQVCKQQFKELRLYGVFKQNTMAIAWEDPCFYFNYQNMLETHRVLYDSMVRYGFFQKTK